jgi:WD40 repeat protein
MEKKQFITRKKFEDGTLGEPEIHRIEDLDFSWRMGRRGFLVTSAIGIAAFSLMKKLPLNAEGNTAGEMEITCRDYAPAHDNYIASSGFSGDSAYYYTMTGTGHLDLWKIPEGDLVMKHESVSDDHTLAGFMAPDGRSAVMVTGWGNVIINNALNDGKVAEFKFTREGQYVINAVPSGDGSLFAADNSGFITIVDVKKRKAVSVIPAVSREQENNGLSVKRMVFSGDNRFFIVLFNWGDIHAWSIPSGKHLWSLKGDFQNIAAAPDGKSVIAESKSKEYFSGTLAVFNMANGKLLHDIYNDNTELREYQASDPGFKTVIVKRYDKKESRYVTEIWSVKEKKVIAVAPWRSQASTYRILKNGTALLARIFDEHANLYTIGLYSYPDCRELKIIYRGKENIHNVDISPDEKTAAVHVGFGCVTLIDPAEGIPVSTLFDPSVVAKGSRLRKYYTTGKDGRMVYRVSEEKTVLPGNAVCTCNTVEGTSASAGRTGSGSGGSYIRICTCVPVK